MKILHTSYKKADLQAVLNNCTHLNSAEKDNLLELLKKFEQIFNGTLGHWRTKPVSLQLKDEVTSYHGRAFPIPKVHKDVLMEEIQRLCDLGVLECQPSSEWAAPSFIQPKKNTPVCFLTNFWEVNKRQVRKSFPSPKISTLLQELEGFIYATALD